jgi:hypothetical protein
MQNVCPTQPLLWQDIGLNKEQSSSSRISKGHLRSTSTPVCCFPWEVGNLHDQGHCCVTVQTVVLLLEHSCAIMGTEVTVGTLLTMTYDHISATCPFEMSVYSFPMLKITTFWETTLHSLIEADTFQRRILPPSSGR